MQQNNTQGILRKKDRLKSRKFSQDEPYDRASDEQLINSSLGGGRKNSLQPGTLIQGQTSGLTKETVRYTPSLQDYIPEEPLTNASAGSNIGTNYATTTSSQGFNQPEYVNNTGINNNYQTSFETERSAQQGFTTNTGASNNYPTSYETQTFNQPGYINNTSTVPQQDIYQQGAGTGYETNYGTGLNTNSNYISSTGAQTQSFTQPGYINNTGTVFQQDLNQQGLYAGAGYGTNYGTGLNTNSNYISGTGAQGFPQQGFSQQGFSQQGYSQLGLISGAALGTGLGLGTAYATGTGIQNLNQAGFNNTAYTGTQGLTQPGQSTGVSSGITSATPTTNLGTTPSNTNTVNQYGSNSRGTFTFRPLEGKFTKNKDLVGKMDPYCKIKIGLHSGKTSVAKSEGNHPVWSDVITIEKKHNEQFAKIKVKDHDKLTLNDKIGEAKISLNDVSSKGKVNQWFPVYKKDQMTGEILMEISFQPRGTAL